MAKQPSDLRNRLQKWFDEQGLVHEPTSAELLEAIEADELDQIEVDRSGLPDLVGVVKTQLREEKRSVEIGDSRVPLAYFLRFLMTPTFVPTAGEKALKPEEADQMTARVKAVVSSAISENLSEEEMAVLELLVKEFETGRELLDDEQMLIAEEVLDKLRNAIGEDFGPIDVVVRALEQNLNG